MTTTFEEDRMLSSINCRQNLVNYFEFCLDPTYKPKKAFVNLEDENSIKNYFSLSNLRINSIRNHFKLRGTPWQKEQLCIGLRE